MYQSNTLYTLNLQNVTCQIYPIKKREREKKRPMPHFPARFSDYVSVRKHWREIVIVSLIVT